MAGRIDTVGKFSTNGRCFRAPDGSNRRKLDITFAAVSRSGGIPDLHQERGRIELRPRSGLTNSIRAIFFTVSRPTPVSTRCAGPRRFDLPIFYDWARASRGDLGRRSAGLRSKKHVVVGAPGY